MRPIVGVDAMRGEAGAPQDAFIPRGEAVATYEVSMHGVAVFERSTGVLAERLWVIVGGLTATAERRATSRSIAPSSGPDPHHVM